MASPWQNLFVPIFTPFEYDNRTYKPNEILACKLEVPLWREHCAQTLLQAGYRPNTAAGLTAVAAGSIGLTNKLIDLGANVNGARAQHGGRTALEGASEHGRLDTVALLLEKAIASLLETQGKWTGDNERNLAAFVEAEDAAVDRDHREDWEPHPGCHGECCSDCRSVDENMDEPQCWDTGSEETGSEVSEEDLGLGEVTHGLMDKEKESRPCNGDPATDTSEQAARHNTEDPTEGVFVEDLSTTDQIPDWSDWVEIQWEPHSESDRIHLDDMSKGKAEFTQQIWQELRRITRLSKKHAANIAIVAAIIGALQDHFEAVRAAVLVVRALVAPRGDKLGAQSVQYALQHVQSRVGVRHPQVEQHRVRGLQELRLDARRVGEAAAYHARLHLLHQILRDDVHLPRVFRAPPSGPPMSCAAGSRCRCRACRRSLAPRCWGLDRSALSPM
ncbi:ankyrin [Apiospora phragmitis]|uniref:Ankyrin n=1 Tax=Apiospora phragmitis TaxID=2905665 RepID=A0ABR1VY05_9PEZI